MFAALSVALCVIAFTGCAGRLTPQGAASATALAVYAFGENNPKITENMRRFQPVACDLAKNQGATIEDIVGVIQNTGDLDKDTKKVLLVISTIYQTAVLPHGTNTVSTHPYLEAVICEGWGTGLSLLPYPPDPTPPPSLSRNAPPAKVVRAKSPKKLPPAKWFIVK